MFDVCHGLTHCFSSWLPGFEGHIYLDRAEEFLRAYNNKLTGDLPPLNNAEKKYIYEVLQLSNMYMIQWLVRMFNGNKTSNPYEFFYYLQHQLGCVRWVEQNKEAVRDMAQVLRQLKMEEF
jgi:homoserine kinase type II